MPLIFTALSAAALLVLLLCIVRGWDRGRYASKPVASLGFILVALSGHALGAHPAGLGPAIVVGLCLGAVGDVALMLPGRRAFLVGLIAFAAGHLAYVLAFHLVVPARAWITPAALVPALVGALVYAWLRPHLGAMRVPVIAYIVIISAMVIAALAVFQAEDQALPERARYCLAAGALLFYASDLAVARERFVRESVYNRVLGLPVYYAGQLLLAFGAVLAA